MLADRDILRRLNDTHAANGWKSGPILYRRRVAGVAGPQERTIEVRLADNEAQLNCASDLLNRMYSTRGYGSNHQLTGMPHSTTFTVSSDTEIVGTLTLSIDSPRGLSIDETFGDELDEIRSCRGASLCELTKFAFDPSPQSRPMLAALFHIIYIYGTQKYDCTDLLIEVNPRHVRFYDVMLGFSRVGPLKTNAAVKAPSQLMRLKVSEIRKYIDVFAGSQDYAGHSLYPFFFSVSEESSLQARIADVAFDEAMEIGSWNGAAAASLRRAASPALPIAA